MIPRAAVSRMRGKVPLANAGFPLFARMTVCRSFAGRTMAFEGNETMRICPRCGTRFDAICPKCYDLQIPEVPKPDPQEPRA